MAPPRKTIDALPEQGVYEAGNYLIVQDSGVTKKMAASLLVNQAGTPLQAHLDDATDAHDASAISATASGAGVDGPNVQAQLGQIAALLPPFNEVQVGADEPTDAAIELWYDSDDAAGGVTGINFADDAETIAGASTSQAVTPAGRKAAETVIDPRSYGFSTAATGAVNSAALQAAIDEACGPGDPVAAFRYANRAVVIPAGTYKLATTITIRSVLNLEIVGVGNPVLQADAAMSSVFDINGMAYSRFGGFTVAATAGVQVDNVVYVYHDAAGSLRSVTQNSFHDITIRNIDYVTAIRIGKVGSNAQVDNDEFRNIQIAGTWTTGETGRYQHGLYLGTGVSANNLIHHVYHYVVTNVRYPLYVSVTQVAVYGAGFAGCDTAIYFAVGTGFACFDGLDIENAERVMFTTGSTANANIALSNIRYRANDLIASGRFVDINMGGTVSIKHLFVSGATITPIIDTSFYPSRVEVENMSVAAATLPDVEDCFVVGAGATIKVRGFVKCDTSNQSVSVADWDSSASAAGGVSINEYTTPGTYTWTKPAGALRVTIMTVGGGGGGGSGRRGAAGTIRCGGGGGGGGGWTSIDWDAADLGASLSVTVGAGGTGGPAITVDDTNGTAGTAGAGSYVRSSDLTIVHARSNMGLGGGGGTVSAGTGGAGGSGALTGAAGGAASATGGVGAAGTAASGAGGGGAGGGITSGNVAINGGNGGTSNSRDTTAPAGGAIGANGTSSTSVIGTKTAAPEYGAGGGGSNLAGVGGTGGTSNGIGGGGGGGGASVNGNNSGAGGNGGNGRVVIVSYG